MVALWKNRLTLICLALMLLAGAMIPAQGFAAEGDVKSIEFENASPVFLYVDHQTAQLKVLATIEGSSTKKEVTADVVWVSSAPQSVKVDKGLLTGVAKGSAAISAKYKGFTITLNATSDYLFKELKLSADQTMDMDLGSSAVAVSAFAVEEEGDSYEVSDDAVWTSSNSSVAAVSKGQITPVSKGTATITARYKGLSATVKVNVSSPYYALQIEGGSSVEMTVGQEEVQLKAQAKLVGGAFEDVTEKAVWSSSNAGAITVDKGKLNAVGTGIAKITVSYLGVSTEAHVIARLPYQALILSPQKDQYIFTTDAPVQISVFVANDAASRNDVTAQANWTSSNPMAVTVNQGLITPKAPGKSIVKISYRGLTEEIQVSVMPVISNMKIDSEDLSLFKNEVQDVPAVVGTDLEGKEIDFSPLADWTSDHEDTVKVESGKLVAGKPGSAKLTVTMKGYTDTLNVTVQEKVLMLKPSYTNLSLVVGQETGLPTVKAVLEDGTEQDVTSLVKWKSSSPNLLVKGSTLKALLGSKVNLEGTYLNKSLKLLVVLEEPLASLTVEPVTVRLNPGRGQSIKVKGTYADGKEVTLSSKVQWISSNSSIATVKGSVVKGAAEGSATLTASYQGKPLTVTVNVVPKLTKLKASETSFKLKAGDTVQANVQALFDSGKTVDVTGDTAWSSSNTSVVTVTGGEITAVKKGSATIKATYNKKTVSIRVTVN